MPCLPLEFRVGRQAGGRKNRKWIGKLISLRQFYQLKIELEQELNVTDKIAQRRIVYNNKRNYAYVLQHLFTICKVNNDFPRRIFIENAL